MITYSIIKKSQLEGAHRLDAEFYCVSNDISGDFVLGEDAVEFVQYGTSKELNEERKGFPVLRLNEFDDFFITTPEKYCNKISEEVFNSLKLKAGDVLICRTNGNPKFVGKSAVVLEDTEIAFASYLFRVRPKKEVISPESLAAFLNSKAGRTQIERFLMPSIQSNFSPAQFRAIKIPLLSREKQDEIDDSVRKSFSLRNNSLALYSQAENLLLEELGLSNFKAEEELFSVVKLSEVKNVNRIDAEYFQPKYEKLSVQLKKSSAKKLEEVIENVAAKFDAAKQPDEMFKYVELSNINASTGIIDGFSEVLGKEAPSRAKRVLKVDDVIVSSVEGSLEKAALVHEDQKDFLASTGFFQFRSKEILPEVILILAKSPIFQWQLEKRCAGTILTAVPKESIKDILIPVLPKSIQQKIAELVRQSHEARKKAKELLEEAKRKVEEMIEG